MTLPAIATLVDAVTLDEINARAALTTRRDRKYLVPADRLATLFDHLADRIRVLEIDGRRSFAYDTHYFDSPALHCYLDTARRRPFRYKIRTRRYLDTDRDWFEIKQRSRRGITVKHRWEVHAAAHRFGPDEQRVVADVLGPDVADRPLEHRLTTRFGRSTILLDGDTRMTIDVDATFSTPDGRREQRLRPAIVETKTTGSPSIADRALWRLGIRPAKISKYGTGLASLHPDLPANRWHRLLHSDAWTVPTGV